MNETLSLLAVTSLLAVGGLGLYMFKSSDDDTKGGAKYNEDSLFGTENMWGNNGEEYEDEDEIEEPKVKPRSSQTKTKRHRKSTGTTKRRY
jgi:hypothetical protein